MPEKRRYADRAESIKRAVAKRRKRIKELVIEYKGGKCIICGYSKCPAVLELHHLDEATKKFGLGMNGLTRSWERTRQEADKCILVCANCHREIHAGIVQLPREIGVEKRGELREA
ncbi:HNH endonuclease [Patescibacteria group bacterium]|nr:HNH endonuclease [Patescibacteria group bacterium]